MRRPSGRHRTRRREAASADLPRRIIQRRIMRIKGKVAVVTGSSSGVGEATAELLASLGASVVVNYHSGAEAAERIVGGIRDGGGNAVAVQADMRKDADCRRLIDSAVEAFGALHILVNNAGMTHFIAHDDLEGVTDEVWGRHSRRQPARCLQLHAGGRAAHEGGGRGRCGQRRLDRRHRRRRQQHSVRRVKGRGHRDDEVAGARARPGDPGQHDRPRLHRGALAAWRTRRRELRQGPGGV